MKYRVTVNYHPGGNEFFLLGNKPSREVKYFETMEEAKHFAKYSSFSAPSGAYKEAVVEEVEG